MKTFFKYQIATLALAVLAFAGCQEDELTAPISPDGYPIATFTTDFSGSEIVEGDTIIYTIKLDKPVDRPITFAVRFDTLQTKGNIDIYDINYELINDEPEPVSVTIPAYYTEAEIMIIVQADNMPELDENLRLEVGAFLVGERYLLNPKSVNPKLNLTVKAPGAEFEFGWSAEDDDFDMAIVDEAATAVFDGWAGATGANPEHTLLTSDTPDGTYFVEVDPYSVASEKVDYSFVVGAPGAALQSFTGVFDMTKVDTYEIGGVGYKFLKVVKSGNTYTVTHILPQ